MNISTGISVINYPYHTSRGVKFNKTYLWPIYDAGSVNKIPAISSEIKSEISYIEPSNEEKNRQLAVSKNSLHIEYTSNAKALKHPSHYYPGSLFDAMA